MPSPTSHADIFEDLDGLLEAIQRTPELQPGIEVEQQALVQSLTEVRTLKARQQELTALKQESTQQLSKAVARAREVAIQVRSVVRGRIGPRSERLFHFRVAPIRKRPRKPPVVKPPEGETSGTVPGAVTSPPAQPVE